MGAVLQGTQELIVSFHELTHVPWFLTIPLTALGISVLFRLPFSIYTQKIHQRRAALMPILQAWNARIQRDVDVERILPSRRAAEARDRLGRVTKRIWKKFGLQDWRMFANVLGLPFWLVGIDAVRRLCGGPRGILGRLVFGAGEADASAAVAESGSDGLTDTTMPVSGTSSIPAGTLPGPEPSNVGNVAEAISQTAAEPSLTTGGALWFPDLTIADPWHVLPLALSAVLVVNLWPSTDAGRRALFNMGPKAHESNSAAPGQLSMGARVALRIQRFMLPVSLLIGPLTMDLPAALHLYWITSASASWATTKILKRAYPLSRNAIEPCKNAELSVIRPKRGADVVDAQKIPPAAKASSSGTRVQNRPRR